jgi:hypothetical protein
MYFLQTGVVGISEIIIRPGLINVDFADVRTIMGDAGTALMGIGKYVLRFLYQAVRWCCYRLDCVVACCDAKDLSLWSPCEFCVFVGAKHTSGNH